MRREQVAVLQQPTVRTGLLATCGPVGARHGWMALHGLDQRASSFVDSWTRMPHSDGRRVLAPEGLSRHILDTRTDATGACWVTIPDRPTDLEDTFAWLDACAERLDVEVGQGARVLLGFSQGSLIAARWAVARSRVWDRVVLWGAAPPGDVDLHALANRSRSGLLHLVLGDRDEFATSERREQVRSRLHEAGVGFEITRFDGGHRLDDHALADIAAQVEQFRPAR